MPVLLTEEEIAQKLLTASDWERQGAEITRHLKFADFKGAMRFTDLDFALAAEINRCAP
jgi:pterin-4a-carbinolamine dehydratase